jgi:hypothetical protein
MNNNVQNNTKQLRSHRMTTKIFEWVRRFVEQRYPDDPGPEHVFSAIAKVLLTAAVAQTTSPMALVKETGYPLGFVLAIAWNMTVSGRWTEDRYDLLKTSGELIDRDFWDDVSAAAGEFWYPQAATDRTVVTSSLFGASTPQITTLRRNLR